MKPQKIDDSCPKCLKSPDLCICSEIRALKTRLHVLILQHPQEPDKDLGSARIAHLALPNSTLKIGLSWPNLKAALGREAQPSRWAVLYLGSGAKKQDIKTMRPENIGKKSDGPTLQFVDKKGIPVQIAPGPKDFDGIILIDGTWSQAKALWWRNAWLLKCKRAILSSDENSLYKELRKEPRRECLSTIETIADSLTALGESKETSRQLKQAFSKLLDRKREQLKAARAAKAAPKTTPTETSES